MRGVAVIENEDMGLGLARSFGRPVGLLQNDIRGMKKPSFWEKLGFKRVEG